MTIRSTALWTCCTLFCALPDFTLAQEKQASGHRAMQDPFDDHSELTLRFPFVNDGTWQQATEADDDVSSGMIALPFSFRRRKPLRERMRQLSGPSYAPIP